MPTANAKNIFDVFVSMPYGAPSTDARRYWNDFYNAIIDMKPSFDTRGYTLNFKRASETISHLQLKESVMRLINESQFVIAVITGLNPNVFWEVGYAECLAKPVIFLVEEHTDEAKNSPVLVNATLKVPYDGTVFDKKTAVPTEISDFQGHLVPFLTTAVEVVRGKAKKPIQFKVFSDRASVPLQEMIAGAQKTIDLITSNLKYFADEANFYIEADGKKQFPFDQPVERGVKLRILCLNPDSSVAEYRAKQLGLGYDVSGYREEVRSSARFFYQRYGFCHNVDIRIYDDLPLQITLMVDEKIVTSIMSRGNRSRDNIHLYFESDVKGAQDSFSGHFKEVLANQAQTSHISHFKWAHTHEGRETGDGLVRK